MRLFPLKSGQDVILHENTKLEGRIRDYFKNNEPNPISVTFVVWAVGLSKNSKKSAFSTTRKHAHCRQRKSSQRFALTISLKP